VDGGRGDIDVEPCGKDGRMLLEGHRGGVVAAARQIPVHRLGGPQLTRRVADHLGIGCPADGEIDFGGIQIRLAAAEPRFGLRGVGRSYVAGIETPLGDAEDFPQECDIGALRLHERLIGEHIAVCGDGVEQHALTDISQCLATRLHLQFRHAHAICGLEAIEQRLRHRHPDSPGCQGRGLKRIVGQQISHRLQPCAQAGDDLRPVARQGLRDVLVSGALPRPFGIELRIGLVGFGQGLGERFRRRRGSGKTDTSRKAKANARLKHAPSHVANFSGTPDHMIPQQTPAVRPPPTAPTHLPV
jgi:hypothetical protein